MKYLRFSTPDNHMYYAFEQVGFQAKLRKIQAIVNIRQ